MLHNALALALLHICRNILESIQLVFYTSQYGADIITGILREVDYLFIR